VVEGNVCRWVTDGLPVKECWACRLVHGRKILCSERFLPRLKDFV
jgi:hypothetical protein